MSVYKIFPTADATIYSRFPTQNTGLDEILEVSVKNGVNTIDYTVAAVPSSALLQDDIRRSLITFTNQDISIIEGFATGSWQAGLRLFLANAENLETTYSIQVGQVGSSWDRGVGKFSDYPVVTDGASWYNPNFYTASVNGWTGYTSTYYQTPGGGNWTGSFVEQLFSYKDSKDLNLDVTYIVNNWFSGSTNNGFLIKHPIEVETNSTKFMALNFFSVDTHTIYPPTLEMRWDDSSYVTGSLSIINNNQFVVSIDNNLQSFKYNTGKYRFRVNSRDKYPARTFSTSSVYTVNKALPQTAYWALQDLKSEDIIVDYDNNYTKISCDATGSYFDLYMTGLEPERYYRILLKTVLPSGESIEFDNNDTFKIIR